jgi:hypothetical protein
MGSADLFVWNGLNLVDGTEYHARFEKVERGRWNFWIEKRLAGRALRRQHALGAVAVTRAQGMKHAYNVLGSLATCGAASAVGSVSS